MAYKQIRPIPVSEGGTGATTLTGVLTGNGTSAVTAHTVTQHGVLIGGASNAVSSLGVASNGQLVIGSTSADPVLATLSAGTGISVSNGAGTITITAAGGGTTWTEVTGTSANMAVDNGYIANNAGLVTLTLPTTVALGSVIKVVGKGAGGWKIAQSSGQQINFGLLSSTSGATGFISSTAQYDCVELVCITANNIFVVRSSIGNITVS